MRRLGHAGLVDLGQRPQLQANEAAHPPGGGSAPGADQLPVTKESTGSVDTYLNSR